MKNQKTKTVAKTSKPPALSPAMLRRTSAHKKQIGVRFTATEYQDLIKQAAEEGRTSLSNHVRAKLGFPSVG